MHEYVCVLGAVPDVSEVELRSVIGSDVEVIRTGQEVRLFSNVSLDTGELCKRLGGTIRIDEYVETLPQPMEGALADILDQVHAQGKLHFGISGVNHRVGLAVKKELKARGRSVRYVEIKNSASIVHNGLVDRGTHLVVRNQRVYVTRAVHDFEGQATQDELRPAVDPKSGMLPPKLSRMMINIARNTPGVLLDPFCGSGTVLMEAVGLGFIHLYGTDLSEKAVADTQLNLTWLKEQEGNEFDSTVLQQDVRMLEKSIARGTIDVIVTEPYMGAPKKGNERKDTLEREASELSGLYAKSLEQFSRVLKSGGTVVFTKPRFRYEHEWITIPWESAIDMYGFSVVPLALEHPWLLYVRDGQHVGREIWKLEKK